MALLLAVASASGVQANDPVHVPRGEARAPAAADLGPHEATSGSFNERWSYHIALEGGTQLYINFSLARLSGFREPTSGADLSVLGFRGQDYFVAREYPVATHFRYNAAGAHLAVHPQIYFEGAPPRQHRVRFATTKEGVSYEVDLTFSDIAQGMTWGDGIFRLGSEAVWMAIHIPYARVSGTVTINGDRQSVRGTGYMDHTYQTTYAPRIVRSAFRIVRHSGSGWEVGYYMLPTAGYEDRPVGFGLRRAGGQTTLLRPREIEAVNTRRALGVTVPGQLRVAYTDGSQTLLTRRSDRQAFSALDDLAGVTKAVVRRFIGGEVLHFRGNGAVGGGGTAAYDFLIVR